MMLLIPEICFILEMCFFYPGKSPKFLKIPEFREKWKHRLQCSDVQLCNLSLMVPAAMKRGKEKKKIKGVVA